MAMKHKTFKELFFGTLIFLSLSNKYSKYFYKTYNRYCEQKRNFLDVTQLWRNRSK